MTTDAVSDANVKQEASREQFRNYWVEEHGAPTLENMMLDSNAAVMDVLERPEILAELPSLSGKDVLELGSGIGRFSSSLADKASSVIAVDFVEASCKINRDSNTHFTNLQVVCEDALKLSFQPNTFDIVFSNWLLMYLSDDEVQTLANNCLNWLKPGGRIFFRESCFHRSGNAPRTWNPTVYRDPRSYFQFFNSARGSDGSRFQLCKTSCVHAYVRIKNNPNQVWWIWEKCTTGHLIRYLDTQQYDYNSVFRYEKLYGDGFISTGGKHLIENVVGDHLALQPGARVLDVGCGLGGNMLFFANQGCYVHGIDISGVMVSIASERYLKYPADIQKRMSIQVGDIFDSNFIPNSFDVICCRDFLMHFSDSDKEILLSKFHRWLAPGGSVFLTDYVRGSETDFTPEFKTYVDKRQYQLQSEQGYASLLSNLHFSVKPVASLGLGSQTDAPTTQFRKYLEHQVEVYKERTHEKSSQIAKLKSSVDFASIFTKVYAGVAPPCIDHDERAGHEDELAILVAQAGADAARQYVESKESLLKEEAKNLEWVEKYWGIKMDAVLRNELGYCVFVAQKPVE
jgi:phosphoethanolamine N-methyltransferase